ncbi:MAG TPA: FecR family protein [Puia sp.]|jgi:transmembrane sensor|nr:FecR family protein [Puia sp.]
MRGAFLLCWWAAGVFVAGCRDRTNVTPIAGGKGYENEMGSKQRIRLPDGSAVILGPGAKVDLGKGFSKGNRQVELDGEAWFDVGAGPFELHTRDLVVEVLSAARFHANAVRSKPGEEIDLLEGKLRAKKSYHSDTDNEAEVLGPGEMVMINRDIDLMEKEKLNPAELDKLKEGW